MGIFDVSVRVANPSAPDKHFQDRFIVDTGAIYSSVPEDRLDGLGIPAVGHRGFLLADGRTGQLRIGSALFLIEGFPDQFSCPVIFAPKGSPCLLGATSLEFFGLEVDPTRGVLRKRDLHYLLALGA